MSLTPVIKQPAETMNFAGITISRFSGFDSTAAGADTEITNYIWDFGDGSRTIGPEASHIYRMPGTYTVTLTIVGDAGTINSITDTIVVNQFKGRIFFVSDSLGDDGNPGTASKPWKSITKVLNATSDGKVNNPDVVLFMRGDAWNWAGDLNPHRPSIWGAYGSGADPVINMNDKAQVYILDDAGGIPNNQFGYSVYWNGIHIVWPSKQNGGINVFCYGSQFMYVTVENGVVIAPSGTQKVCMQYSTIKYGNYTGFFSSGNWSALIGCSIIGCGNDWIYHHQAYFSNNTYILVTKTTFDGLGATAASFGCKFSGVRKYFVFMSEELNNNYAFDVGSNGSANGGDREGQDGVFDRVSMHSNGVNGASGALWITFMNRCLFKNCKIFNCDKFFGQAVVIFRGNNSNEKCRNVRIYNCTFFSNATHELSLNDFVEGVEFMNNIIFRNKNGNLMCDFIDASPAVFKSDYNTFFSTNASGPDDSSIFQDSTGKKYSFHEWQSKFGQDANSVWGDPKFVDVNLPDLHLGAGSAAKDIAKSIPAVFDDFDNKDRFADMLFDCGAYVG